MNILFVADVVGRPGREALEHRLASLRLELDAAFCIVNGENVADGAGITPKLAERLLLAGADAITLGNHTWRRPEIASYLSTSERVLRPANLSDSAPGRGLGVLTAADGTTVAIVNVMGSLFLEPKRSMWEIVDELVDEARAVTPVVIVDVHAEATSEKVALARWLDGRVTAVVGTHTHVQTADARIRAVRNPLFYGCPIGRPFLILDLQRSQRDERRCILLYRVSCCIAYPTHVVVGVQANADHQPDQIR
jgi:metallophosphoesterase (TIGR00282 family)